MRAAVLLILLTLGYVPRAYAADDATLREVAISHSVSFDAPLTDVNVVLVPAEQRVREGRAMVACEARSERLEAAVTASTPLPPLVVVGLVVLAAALGAGVTYGAIKATGAK